ncbi:hypothetical protein HDV02_006398 [Globomyces sp. JEL0801]|nr:hypothetical protein HDV02_006398 [Globomyces sp. JEL0801]
MEEMQIKMEKMIKENIRNKDESETLRALNKTYENKIVMFEKQELMLLEERQKQTHEMEEARFERDTVAKREQNLIKELESINQKCLEIPKLYNEKNELALQKYIQKISLFSLRAQFAAERRRFCEETGKLEDLIANLQCQNDRAIRDKRAAESELDKITRHIPAEADRLAMALDELHSKLRASEREKHESIQKLDLVHQKMIREQNQFESERHQYNERSEEAYRRLKRLEREVEDNKKDHLALQQHVATLEHDKKALLDQIRVSTAGYESQAKMNIQKYESHIADLTSKLENVTEAHSTTCREMQRLLATQRTMGDKWKDESQHIRSHYENVISKMKVEISHYHERIQELEHQIQKHYHQRKELIDQTTNEKRQYSQLHEKYLVMEKSNETLSRQVQTLISKETEMIEDRKRLSKELDRAVLEGERKKKSSFVLKPKQRSVLAELNEQMIPTMDLTSTKQLEADIERIKQRSKTRHFMDFAQMAHCNQDESDT